MLRMKVMRLLSRGLGPSKDQSSFPPSAEVAHAGCRTKAMWPVGVRPVLEEQAQMGLKGRACGQAGRPNEGPWAGGQRQGHRSREPRGHEVSVGLAVT